MNLAFNVMNLVLKSDEFGFKMMNFAALHGLRRDGGPLPRAGKRLLIYQAPACSTDLLTILAADLSSAGMFY